MPPSPSPLILIPNSIPVAGAKAGTGAWGEGVAGLLCEAVGRGAGEDGDGDLFGCFGAFYWALRDGFCERRTGQSSCVGSILFLQKWV